MISIRDISCLGIQDTEFCPWASVILLLPRITPTDDWWFGVIPGERRKPFHPWIIVTRESANSPWSSSKIKRHPTGVRVFFSAGYWMHVKRGCCVHPAAVSTEIDKSIRLVYQHNWAIQTTVQYACLPLPLIQLCFQFCPVSVHPSRHLVNTLQGNNISTSVGWIAMPANLCASVEEPCQL